MDKNNGHLYRSHYENNELDNVFTFHIQMGLLFDTDANQLTDVKVRIVRAMTRCGQLINILNFDKISLDLKLRLYETSVLSLS